MLVLVQLCVSRLVCADASVCLVVVPACCRCALQEASQLQGDVQQLGQQVQDLAQQLLEAQNAKVRCPLQRAPPPPCLLIQHSRSSCA